MRAVADEPYPIWWEQLPPHTFKLLVQGWKLRHRRSTPPAHANGQDDEPCAERLTD